MFWVGEVVKAEGGVILWRNANNPVTLELVSFSRCTVSFFCHPPLFCLPPFFPHPTKQTFSFRECCEISHPDAFFKLSYSTRELPRH